MAEQLNIGQLILALDAIPGNPLVGIDGFGADIVPGDLHRHRSHIPDLAIEAVYQRMSWKTVERFKVMLQQHASEPISKWNPHPTTLDSPVWVRRSTEYEKSFLAVTGVDLFEDRAVIRSENMAPLQGPAIQRIPDVEVLRRNAELAGNPDADLDVKKETNRWMLDTIPKERDAARVRLNEARDRLAKLIQEIPRMEAESARYNYTLGITDTLAESARLTRD
jgi:hypothetical protein